MSEEAVFAEGFAAPEARDEAPSEAHSSEAEPSLIERVRTQMRERRAERESREPMRTPAEPTALTPPEIPESASTVFDAGVARHAMSALTDFGLDSNAAAADLEVISEEFRIAAAMDPVSLKRERMNLKADWGTDYQANAEVAKLAFQTVFGEHFRTVANSFVEGADELVGDNPRLIRLFAKLGKRLGKRGEFVANDEAPAAIRDMLMTESNAKATLGDLMSDPSFRRALMDKSDPGHAEAVRRRHRLYEQVHSRG